MSGAVILAVDPDQTVLSFIRRLVIDGRDLFCGARRGEDALRKAREARPAVVVSRAELPDMGGREFVARLFEETGGARAPILLTALRGREAEAAAALEAGAVDVLFFPFEDAEFAARLGTLIQWGKSPACPGAMQVGPVAVDLDRARLLKPQPHALTGSEVQILRCLLSPPGRAMTRRQVPVETERAVDVHVASLRSKLGRAGACIETVRGIGYRFVRAACL